MASAEKITIALTPEMARVVREAVESGEFASTSEAVRDAARQWKERRDLLGYTVGELRELAQVGIGSGPSRYASMDKVKAEARRRLELDSGCAH